MGKTNSKDALLSAMRADDEKTIRDLITAEISLKNDYINKNDDHTAMCMACYFGSLVSIKILTESGSDINKPEKKEGSTPLIIAAKRNHKSIVEFLLTHQADARHRNNHNLNALDYAIIHGNYEIAFKIKKEHSDLIIKPLDEYIENNLKMKVPCFNIPLFYQNLCDGVEPVSTPPFHLTNEQQNRFEGMIPDPNETWGDFFKRIMRFEVYHPPLVKKDSVPIEKRFTNFVKMQTKLLEMQYNQEIKLGDDHQPDIENANPESVELRLKDNQLNKPEEAIKKSENEEISKENEVKINEQDRI